MPYFFSCILYLYEVKDEHLNFSVVLNETEKWIFWNFRLLTFFFKNRQRHIFFFGIFALEAFYYIYKGLFCKYVCNIFASFDTGCRGLKGQVISSIPTTQPASRYWISTCTYKFRSVHTCVTWCHLFFKEVSRGIIRVKVLNFRLTYWYNYISQCHYFWLRSTLCLCPFGIYYIR